MTMSKKTAADFNIPKGTALVGALKPNKVSARKVYEKAQGIVMAGNASNKMMVAKVPINNG